MAFTVRRRTVSAVEVEECRMREKSREKAQTLYFINQTPSAMQKFFVVFLSCCAVIIGYTLLWKIMPHGRLALNSIPAIISHNKDPGLVTVAIAGCDKGLTNAIQLIKSIFISSWPGSRVDIYLFTEPSQHETARQEFDKMANSRAFSAKPIVLHVLDATFPPEFSQSARNLWKRVWAPCATQRLFMLDTLPAHDALIYLDGDSRILASIQLLWNHFYNMNDSQIIGMVAEHEQGVAHFAWYTKDRLPPHVEPLGMNSGVLLMNLTRMRAVNFKETLMLNYAYNQPDLGLQDQDLLNLHFHQHPDQLYRLPCAWNYRLHHCHLGKSNCLSAEQEGILLLHGYAKTLYTGEVTDRGHYHSVQVQYPQINSAIEQFNPDEDLEHSFREPLRKKLLESQQQNMTNGCGGFYLPGMDKGMGPPDSTTR